MPDPPKVEEPKIKIEDTETVMEYQDEYECPYCLHKARIMMFMKYTKSKKVAKMMECPSCHNGFRRDTLVRDMTTAEYAKWLYETIRWGGYAKIKWDGLKAGLKRDGIASEFWYEWKKAKAAYKLEHHEMAEEDYDRMDKAESYLELLQYLKEFCFPLHCRTDEGICAYTADDDAENIAACMCACPDCLRAKELSQKAKDRRA